MKPSKQRRLFLCVRLDKLLVVTVVASLAAFSCKASISAKSGTDGQGSASEPGKEDGGKTSSPAREDSSTSQGNTVPQTAPPKKPVVENSGEYTAGTQLEAKWSTPEDEKRDLSFVAVGCQDQACSTECTEPKSIEESPTTIKDLVRGHSYYVCVRAKDSGGRNSDWGASEAPIQVNQVPTWSSPPTTIDLTGPYSISETINASDPDSGQSLTYTLISDATTCGDVLTFSDPLSLDRGTGEVTGTVEEPDTAKECDLGLNVSDGYETSSELVVKVRVYPKTPPSFSCDSGDLSSTCRINTVQSLANGDYISGPGNIIIENGGEIQGNPEDRVEIFLSGDLTIENGGRVATNLDLLQATNIDIQSGGEINVSTLGYYGAHKGDNSSASGRGPGGGSYDYKDAGGGGHGGQGGHGSSTIQTGGAADSDPEDAPEEFGSSGAAGWIDSGNKGGNGGGRVKIIADQKLTVAGDILASGEQPPSEFDAGGGGAGGSIWITAETVTGSGALVADGANGGIGATCCTSPTDASGGGGGGGRIAIDATEYLYTGSISVDGGYGYHHALNGQDGTVYTRFDSFCDNGDLNTTCYLSSRRVLGDDTSVMDGKDLVIEGTGSIESAGHLATVALSFHGTVTVKDDGEIRTNLAELSGTSITVEENASINASGLGYRGGDDETDGYGPVGGGGSTSSGGGGGGHGGAGGTSVGGTAGGGTDSDPANAPVDFGSGGGGNDLLGKGGAGGGAVKIVASDVLTVNGTVSVHGLDGEDDASAGGGAGAGGSVWLIGSEFRGSGQIAANGGVGGTSSSGDGGGSGAGGRIAVDVDTNNYAGSINALAGTGGDTGTDGNDGTVYYD